MKNEFVCRVGREPIVASLDDIPEAAYAAWTSSNHDHADYELHILLRGSCRMDFSGREVPVTENQAMLIAPGLFHRPIPGAGAFERFSMTLSLEPGPLLQSLKDGVPQWQVFSVDPETAAMCRAIFRERTGDAPCRQQVLECLLTLLLIHQFRQLGILTEDPPVPAGPIRYTELIDPYFEENLGQGARVEALAEALHLSRSQVNRVLKKHYGMTFREKLIRARMDRAAWLLRQTDSRVDDIAAQVGYTAPPSFYQVFRERMGMTPEQYRQQFRP